MSDAEEGQTGDTIKVTIGRFGSTPQEFEIPVNSTVEHALGVADIPYSDGNVFVGGQPARKENRLDDGDIVNVVTSKQGGR